MAKRQLTQEDLDAIFQLARKWGKIVCRQAYGDDGPGLDVDLTNMEDVAVAAMRGLAAGTLETATAQQASQLGSHQPCPNCGKPCLVQQEPRSVTTRGGPFEHSEPKCQCPGCRRDFFPQRLPLKLDGHAYSPKVLHKIVETASHVKSFEVAAHLLEVNAEIAISSRHVNRLTQMIGQELQESRDERTEDYVHHRRQPPAAAVPSKVAVSVDGGRINTREPGHGRGVHEPGWREDKVGCLQVLDGPSFAQDPHPEPPKCFLDPEHVKQMVKGFVQQKGIRSYDAPEAEAQEVASDNILSSSAAEAPKSEEPGLLIDEAHPVPAVAAAGTEAVTTVAPAAAVPEAKPDWPPKREQRTCVASMANSRVFAKMLAAEAYARNFYAAGERCFLGDGLAYNWRIQQKWFLDFTAILDFVHPLSYLYLTAKAVTETAAAAWQRYVGWMTACWQGRLPEVLAEMRQEQAKLHERLGEPSEAFGQRSAGNATANVELSGEQRRTMDYPHYRQRGLPVTSVAVESLIKEFNYRVKGTEKFWNDPDGAEAILQVRAAALSEDDRLAEHILNRPGSPYRRHTSAEDRQTTMAA